MFKDTHVFSGFSIDDAAKAKQFYGETLGMDIRDVEGMERFGMVELHIAGGATVLMYSKSDHQPATYTVLNFPVDDIDKAVDELAAKGVETLRFTNAQQDEKGIARGLKIEQGPDIAWIADPAGNILALLQSEPQA